MAQDSNGITFGRHLMEIIDTNGDPVILKKMIADWPASSWTPDNLHTVFKNEPLSFRVGSSCYDGTTIQFFSSVVLLSSIIINRRNQVYISVCRACLDQLLTAIRSLLIACDHMRSKERLIAINRPIAINLHY